MKYEDAVSRASKPSTPVSAASESGSLVRFSRLVSGLIMAASSSAAMTAMLSGATRARTRTATYAATAITSTAAAAAPARSSR